MGCATRGACWGEDSVRVGKVKSTCSSLRPSQFCLNGRTAPWHLTPSSRPASSKGRLAPADVSHGAQAALTLARLQLCPTASGTNGVTAL